MLVKWGSGGRVRLLISLCSILLVLPWYILPRLSLVFDNLNRSIWNLWVWCQTFSSFGSYQKKQTYMFKKQARHLPIHGCPGAHSQMNRRYISINKFYLIPVEWRIYASINLNFFGSVNCRPPVRRRAIISSSAYILPIWPPPPRKTQI